jgi:hypothetical protein
MVASMLSTLADMTANAAELTCAAPPPVEKAANGGLWVFGR